jgi:hypothetical protein
MNIEHQTFDSHFVTIDIVFDCFVDMIKVVIDIVQDHFWLPVLNNVVLYDEKEFFFPVDYFDLMIDIE